MLLLNTLSFKIGFLERNEIFIEQGISITHLILVNNISNGTINYNDTFKERVTTISFQEGPLTGLFGKNI